MPATPKLPPAAVKPAAPVIPVDVEAIRLLHWASQTGDAAQVQRLVDRGVPIDSKITKQGWTPLLLASHGGHMTIVECLLKGGARPEIASSTGVVALHLAAQAGNVKLVEMLCRCPGIELDATMDNGWTALFFAAQNGHWSVAIHLLREQHVTVDAVDEDGRTALYFASQEGHMRVAKELLSCGADPEGRCEASADGATPLFIASQQGHAEVVSTLVGRGADVNMQKRSGATALHIAAWDGHLDVLKVLLGCGADPMVTTKGNWTCMHCAVRGGNLAIVKYLTEHHPDVVAVPHRRPQHRGIQSMVNVGCGMLRRRPQSVNHQGRKRTTHLPKKAASPLHIACGSGHTEIAEMFLKGKLYDIEARMPGGATPMHIAVQEDQVDMVRLLTAFGASRTPKTDSGVTPLDIAVHKGNAVATDWLQVTVGWKRLELSVYTPLGLGLLHHFLLDPATQTSDMLRCITTLQLQPDHFQPTCDLGAAVRLCRDAALPWRPRTHALYPAAFRDTVETILLTALRINGQPDSKFYLPCELWLTILGRCCRS